MPTNAASRPERSERVRSVVLMLLVPVFLLLLPGLILGLGSALDERANLPSWPLPPFTGLLGLPAILGGLLLGLWSNQRLFTTGRGTPLPVMPTSQLVIEAPYTLCRNPMVLGTILMYGGVSLLFGSLGAMLVVAVAATGLVAYVKLVEEPGLIARFDGSYLQYRRRTPFLLPRVRTRRRVS